MRIVLLNQFFWPDTVATAQFLTDLAPALAQENHVTVICSAAGENGLNPDPGFGPNVEILRTQGIRFSHRGLARIASYASYVCGTIWHCARLSRTDVIFTLTTPPVLSTIGSIFAFLRGARHIIWELDVYPDIATDIGYCKPGGMVDRFIGAVLDWSRRRADTIIVLGEDMKARILARGVREERIHIVENWADGREILPQPFPDGPMVIQYSGNLGLAHEVDTIAAAMERLANDPDFRFVFAGGGPQRPRLEEICRQKGIRNAEFKPYCARTDLNRSLGEGHLGLVTQLPQTSGSVVPSKIYGVMAAGRPLLYIGPRGATPAQHIRRFQCGWHILPGDVEGLVSLLQRLCRNRSLVSEAGARARHTLEQNFDRTIGVERILQIIAAASHSKELVPKLTASATGD